MRSLGRRVEHDPKSLQYPARRVAQPRTVLWEHHAPVLDQGERGSCTFNALAQCLNTTKFAKSRPQRRYLNEDDALKGYSLATKLDNFPGQWPPTDTGSSGLAAAKAGVQLGYLSGYQHAFGFDHFLAAVALQPVIVGTRWDNNMFDPDANGFLRLGGDVAGGHEYLIIGANVTGRYVTMLNSWGQSWGANGRAKIRFSDFTALLNDQGDVTVPTGKG